jgi:hypothetical protein
MIRWFWNLLYGAEAKVFVSTYELEESVRRLAAATSRSVFSPLAEQMAVGKVTESHVSLRRVMRRVGNGFKPHFIGHFVNERGRVVLKGRFTIALFVKVFMSVWFGFLALWICLGIRPLLARDPSAWWLPVFGIGIFLAAVALVWGCKWLARNDAAWLAQLIQDALSSNEPPNSRHQCDAPPTARA